MSIRVAGGIRKHMSSAVTNRPHAAPQPSQPSQPTKSDLKPGGVAAAAVGRSSNREDGGNV